MDDPIPSPEPKRDAWNCDHCGKLMYNTDRVGRPVEGAPDPHFISSTYQRVCSVCWALHENPRLDLDYWQKIQREYKQATEKRKNDIDGLSGSKDYFTGL